jgi:hypothetical protein
MRKVLWLLVVVGVLGFGMLTASAQVEDVQSMLGAGTQTVTVGNLLLDEPFDSPDVWESYQQDSDVNLRVEDGVYRMFSQLSSVMWGMNSQLHTDVVIEADTLQNSAELNNAYGVICRSDVDNSGTGYYFRISGDGYYSIVRAEKTEMVALVEWTQSPVVNQGQKSNHITAVCVGDYLALYVNGELVAEANDSTYSEGYAGLSVSALADSKGNLKPTDVSFDNVRIYEASSGTSVLTPVLSDAAQQTVTVGNLLLDEPFDSADAWEAYQKDSDVNLRVEDGVYRMFNQLNNVMWGLNSQLHTDVVIEADTLQNSEELNNAYGVICRSDVDNNGTGYYFRISGDGYYSIVRGEKTEMVPLVEWTQTPVVNQGQNSNHITAVCVGDYLALYVNGELVAEANDSTYSEGYAGLSVSALADSNGNVKPTDVSFDNLRIYEASSGKGKR